MQKTVLGWVTAMVIFGLALNGCKKDSVSTTTPTITSFSPTSGATGTDVVITGTNYSIIAAGNTVSFNGVATPVLTASTSQLTVTVPAGATSGKITVVVNSISVSSSGSFTVTSSGSAVATWYRQSGISVTKTGQTYYSTVGDSSAVYVTNSGIFTLSDSKIWSSGNTSSTDNSSFYGLNAAVLANSGSTVTLANDSIVTTGLSGNGVFSYGTASVILSNDYIRCTGDGGHGVYAAGGGTLTATDVIATTTGASSSVIATDRGGGKITITGGAYTSGGKNSADVYSTGTINVTGAVLLANGAEAVVIEGSNNATLTNCTTTTAYDKWGIMIYQSSSGDASGTVGKVTISGGSLTYTGSRGGLFYNTNDTAYVYLSNVTLANSCDTLVRSILGSWGGSSATKGGNTHLVCSNQILSGIIYIDSNSKATLNLSNSSSYTGRITTGKIAKMAAATLDATSSWSLTGDSYLTSFTNANLTNSNIISNGYHIFLNGIKIL